MPNLTSLKPAIVRVSMGKRIRVPDEMAEKAKIKDGDYVAIGLNPNGSGLVVKSIVVSV